jgi:hypothetical protein
MGTGEAEPLTGMASLGLTRYDASDVRRLV